MIEDTQTTAALQQENERLREQVATLKQERDDARSECQWMEDLLEQSSIPICLWHGADLVYTYANRAYLQRTGKLDAVGQPLRAVFAEHEVPGLMEMVEQAYANGERQIIPEALVSLENADTGLYEDSWHNLIHNPVRNAAGDVIGVSLFSVDVTTQVRSRQELHKQAQILDQVRGSVIVTDMDGIIISWNRDSTRIFGYEPAEALGQSVSTIYPPEEHERLFNEVIRPLQEQGELEAETIAINKAGQRFPLALSLSLLRDESGTPIGMIGYSVDISERRTMQRTMQASQERLQLVLDAINDGIWDWHIPSGEVYYSPRWMGMLGYAPGELAATLQTWQDLLHPDDQVRAIQTVEAHLRKQSPSFELEFRMRTKAGEWVWILARGKVVAHDAQGQPVRMLGTHTDITGRKQQEAALQQSHAILHTVMDSIDSLIYVADMETYELLYLNKTGVGVFGEIGGRTCWQVLQEDQAGPCVFCTNAHLVDEQGNPKEPHQWEFQNTANGRWYHVYDRAIQWVDGRIVRLEIATDIQDLKQQETELSIFKALVENAPDGVCVTDPTEFRLTYANSAYREMLHYDEELIGMHGNDFVSLDGAQFQQVGEHIMNHGTWQGPLPCRRKDGSIVPTTQSIFMIRDQQGDVQAMAVIARDITEQQQAEAERATLQQQVIEAQREALRELSTPLIPIAENVVIMPLIGTIDSQRAQMIMEALLEGIAHHQADLAILDITGVVVVDTQVAQALIQAAQAVKLLGARVMLTGIQPQIAQTLVHLGTDLGGISTRGSLQSGIAAALQKPDMR